LERARARLGPEHPDTLLAMSNLGAVYTSAGRVADAVPLLEEAVKGMTARLRPGHPRTQAAQQNLEGARALQQRADRYERERAAKGDDHTDTLAARLQLALGLRQVKDLAAAEAHVRAVYEARRRLLGEEHLLTVSAQLELARTWIVQQKYAEADLALRA